MVGALVASAVLLSVLGAARSTWLIALASLLLGTAGDAYRPAAQAAVADLVGFGDRRRASGLIFWAVNLGFSAAAIAGGTLAAAGYGWLFALDAATCLAYAVVVGRFVGETRPEAAEPDATGLVAPGGWSSILRDRVVVAQLGVMFAGAIALTLLFTVLPLSMASDGLGPAAFGAVLAVNGVVIVLIFPALSTRVLARDPARVLALASVFFVAGLLALAVAESMAAYVAALVVMTLGEVLASAIGPGLMQELAPRHLRGRFAGAYGLCFSLAFTVVPIVGTQLLGDGSSAWPWLVGAALAGASVLAQLALAPAIGRRRALAAAEEERLDALDAQRVALGTPAAAPAAV